MSDFWPFIADELMTGVGHNVFPRQYAHYDTMTIDGQAISPLVSISFQLFTAQGDSGWDRTAQTPQSPLLVIVSSFC